MGVYVDDLDDTIPDLPIPVAGIDPLLPPRSMVGERLPSIIEDIERSIAAIPDDADGAIVGHYSRDEWVGAVLLRAPGGFRIKGWIGQEEGKRLNYGIGVLKTFKF
jgi:hypothetical protein